MGFGNLLKYIPSALTFGLAVAIPIGAYSLHRDFREIGDGVGHMLDTETFNNSMDELYEQIAVQDSSLISQLSRINYDLIDMHEALQDIHEGLHDAYPSLDSVVSQH